MSMIIKKSIRPEVPVCQERLQLRARYRAIAARMLEEACLDPSKREPQRLPCEDVEGRNTHTLRALELAHASARWRAVVEAGRRLRQVVVQAIEAEGGSNPLDGLEAAPITPSHQRALLGGAPPMGAHELRQEMRTRMFLTELVLLQIGVEEDESPRSVFEAVLCARDDLESARVVARVMGADLGEDEWQEMDELFTELEYIYYDFVQLGRPWPEQILWASRETEVLSVERFWAPGDLEIWQ